MGVETDRPQSEFRLKKRFRHEILRSRLDLERSSFTSHWQELADYILPRKIRITRSDVNRGNKRNNNIIDPTATLAARTASSGMMSGFTSPARPWFNLSTPDFKLNERGNVKGWLDFETRDMQYVFLKSNLYSKLPSFYQDAAVFGTAAMIVEEDLDEVIRCETYPIGSYSVSTNRKGEIDVWVREFAMTVRAMVQEFGRKKDDGNTPDFEHPKFWHPFSDHVEGMWKHHNRDEWIYIAHVIEPNEKYDPNKLGFKYAKYSSDYFETGGGTNSTTGYGGYLSSVDSDRYLREAGYGYFPVLVLRWDVTAEDIYSTMCPGMVALGDIKQLQKGEKKSAKAIDKLVDPPMIAPTSMRTSKVTLLPADVNYYDDLQGVQGLRPAHDVNFSISELEAKQDQVRKRISRAFYEDLFLMLAQSDRRMITAREIEERHEEKLLALGPVLQQVERNLSKLIDITFDIMTKQKRVAPPPQELSQMPLKVEFTSIMAQAQKLVSVGAVERFAQFAGQTVQLFPEAMDKIDADQMLDVYGDIISVPVGVLRSDEDVEKIRAQRAKQQQAQAAMEAMQQGSQTAKNLSQADMSGENALTKMMDQSQAGGLAPGA